VRSPYYLSREIPSIVVPMPNTGWPAFPDVTLANENLALDGPGQPPAYRAQRALASLQPSARYPFPPTATLVRGTVRASGASLAGATVRRAGQAQEYLTGADGEYVLFFSDIKGTGQAITLEAAHPLHTSASVNVTSVRGMTVLKDITLA
jgi:hypothetical protein